LPISGFSRTVLNRDYASLATLAQATAQRVIGLDALGGSGLPPKTLHNSLEVMRCCTSATSNVCCALVDFYRITFARFSPLHARTASVPSYHPQRQSPHALRGSGIYHPFLVRVFHEEKNDGRVSLTTLSFPLAQCQRTRSIVLSSFFSLLAHRLCNASSSPVSTWSALAKVTLSVLRLLRSRCHSQVIAPALHRSAQSSRRAAFLKAAGKHIVLLLIHDISCP
jgi:hypothetical protein